MCSEDIIKAENLTKIYKDFWNRSKTKAVDGISFKVKKGEIIGFLGPNGSGKSTTVKMLLGLLYPTSGDLKIVGKSPRNVEIKAKIGYLPEETYLYKYLTAYETLDFFASLFNIEKGERRKRIEALLEMVGLTKVAHKRVGEFSKGMARRIGIAQCMINNPDLIILDEPTSGLDPIGCREIKDLIRAFKGSGKTIIMCSHILSDVEELCDRVIIIYGGKIRAEGALNQILKDKDEPIIKVPKLNKGEFQRLLNILRKDFNYEFYVDYSRISLEEYFLKVIDEVRDKHGIESGAEVGGNIPDFLVSS